MKPPTITAIVPAHNEAKNIARVIRALKQASLISEIIVVDDGSDDETARVASQEQVRVIRQANMGKGGAMAAGARSTQADILFFADADLIGLDLSHIAAVVSPVREGRAGMAVGLRDRGVLMWPLLLSVLPVIGGERAIMREYFLAISAHRTARGYSIETIMNAYCKKHHIPVILVPMQGVSQVIQEHKYGWRRGFRVRVRMAWDILRAEIALMTDRTL